ncbi:uncharacterized protein ndufv3 [Stigmatopora nigra]
MSTFMLFSRQLWKLKCYHLERWSPLWTRTSALCTSQNGEAIKTAEKTNDPDERTTLLKYKTSVSFPMRVSNQGSVLKQPLGIADSMSNIHTGKLADTLPVIDNSEIEKTMQKYTHSNIVKETFNLAETTGNVATTKASNSESGDQTRPNHHSALVSDSSDSDSDSDSDSEENSLIVKKSALSQEVPEFPQNTQVNVVNKEDEAYKKVLPEQEANTASDTLPEEVAHAKVSRNTREVEDFSAVEDQVDSVSQFQEVSEDVSEMNETELQAQTNSATESKSPTVPLGVENSAVEAVTKVAAPEQKSTDVVLEISTPVSAKVSTNTAPLLVEDESVIQRSVETSSTTPALPMDAASPCGAPTDLATVVLPSSESTSELLEPLGEELQKDTSLEEDATVALAESEEIVDNSTYQNYQHHNYDPYTFADMDVEMAKYRLPQPSSGRHSPRH